MIPFTPDGVFHHDVGPAALGRMTIRAGGVVVMSQAIAFTLQVVATVILARLLTPQDFGLVTMATTVSLLLKALVGKGCHSLGPRTRLWLVVLSLISGRESVSC